LDKFQNKYRIDSARAGWWDYSASGKYFITICTDGHEHLFGKIRNGEMNLSEIGMIVNQEWYRSFEIRSELFSDSFVIMPNHIHAILRIENNESMDGIVETHGRASLHNGRASLRGPASLKQSCGVAFRPPKSISSFIAGFKSVATKRINEFRKTPRSPVWQPRYYDHLIRDTGEFERINKYILDNPQNWKHDDFNNKFS
jgi:putative transposase